MRNTLLAAGAALAFALGSRVTHAQPPAPDIILTNGKIKRKPTNVRLGALEC